LEFLLRTIKPAVILAHGEPVVRYFEELVGRTLTRDDVEDVEIYGRTVALYPRHHLSYQLSYEDCRRIGALLKRRLLVSGR
jgi:hypothetical protein